MQPPPASVRGGWFRRIEGKRIRNRPWRGRREPEGRQSGFTRGQSNRVRRVPFVLAPFVKLVAN
jgi:hypothetical protein